MALSTLAFAQTGAVRCEDCHATQAQRIAESVHGTAVRCRECHGGEGVYEVSLDLRRLFGLVQEEDRTPASRPAGFEHGETFRGRAARVDIPTLCGACHADVERMNPYGLRTDQLASYSVSGHGKRLKQTGDDRVAVCTDCHGTHDILSQDNARSRTHFRNIAATCGRCHEDRSLMGEFGDASRADIVAQYRASIHGRNVLEAGDAGSPNCATCHGSHGAAPPGFAEVGHVCGQCHKQIEEYFLTSVHGRVPVMARCIGCHGKDGNRTNHQIEKASPPVKDLTETYVRLREELGDDSDTLRASFVEEINALGGSVRLDTVCLNCHAVERRDPHAQFFETNDELARAQGAELSAALRDAQFEYARVAERVARIARGVLLVKDEALQAEDVKTELMALHAFVHTLDPKEIQARVEKIKAACGEIHAALDEKVQSLSQRRTWLLPVWAFAAVFAGLMYHKYKLLKREWISKPGASAVQPVTAPAAGAVSRRRLLDGALSILGAATLAGLLWPAVAFVLPARKRGGAVERVSVGSEEGWAMWTVRKVAVAGKPVAVILTDKGFKAFSAVCTHLGCIVHWNETGREFECPCHAATFDAEGQVVSGPPPAPLPEYGVAVVQGEVIVSQS